MRSGCSALILVAAIVGAAAEARADCAPPDHFAEASRAARVAIVRVTGAPPRSGAPLEVQQVLKGPATPRALTASFNPLTGTSLSPGHRYLAFFTPDGRLVQGCVTLDLAERGAAPIRHAIEAWVKAKDDRARTALLVRAGTSAAAGHDRAASQALGHLAARPDLLAALHASERAALVAAIPRALDDRAYALAWVLARLHAIESVPAWVKLLESPALRANHRPIQDALELMTNHHDPRYVPGRDFYGELAAELRDGWKTWSARNQARPLADALAEGSRARGARLPSLTDRAAVEAAVRGERDELTRRVALNACELLRRSRESALGSSFTHVDWARAPASCGP